jgi:hypothetical protein
MARARIQADQDEPRQMLSAAPNLLPDTSSIGDLCEFAGRSIVLPSQTAPEEPRGLSAGQPTLSPLRLGRQTHNRVLFPPHVMASAPGRSILAASHIMGPPGPQPDRPAQHHLGPAPLRDSHAAGRWEVDNGGEYYAAGVGTGIAGFRADGAVIDDPVRSREDADSERVRDKTWDWYKSDLLTRLRPGGWVILIQTRWHEDDLAGRIFAGRSWERCSRYTRQRRTTRFNLRRKPTREHNWSAATI